MQTVDDANDLRRARGRHRPGHARGGAPVAHPRQVDHRLAVAQQAGHEQGPRLAAGRGRGAPDQGGPGLGSRPALRRPRRGPRALRPARARRRAAGRVGAALPGLARRATTSSPRSGTPHGPASRCPACARRCENIDWEKDKLATRSAGQKAMAAFADFVPTMVGGAADLSESTKTEFPGGHELNYKQGRPARNVFFGVREHGMGGAVNGMAGHGGIVRPYGSTFLQFADYMRGSVRLSALMGLEDAWVYTHDSVGLGRGRPDPPARRAPRRAARDPRPRRHPPRRRQRDGRRVADDPRGPRGAGGADPLAPGPARSCPTPTSTASRAAPTSCAATTTPRWRSSAPGRSCRSPSGRPSC